MGIVIVTVIYFVTSLNYIFTSKIVFLLVKIKLQILNGMTDINKCSSTSSSKYNISLQLGPYVSNSSISILYDFWSLFKGIISTLK